MTRDNRERAARQRRLSQYDPAVLVAAREALGLDDDERGNEAAAPKAGRPQPLMDAPAADRDRRRTSIVATSVRGGKTMRLIPLTEDLINQLSQRIASTRQGTQ